jgi:Fe-Mn family superoxide dismutase
MIDTAKRETLTLLGTAAAGAMMTSAVGAQNASSARPDVRSPMSGGREPKPLTFDPAKLNGLSEKLIRSHWENNYIGSVKTLNMVAGRLLAAMNDPDLPPVTMAA